MKETFVELVLSGKEEMGNMSLHMDEWRPELGIPIYKMLGFKESEWLVIVQDVSAYPYIIQEKAAQRGLIPLDKADYQRLLSFVAPSVEQMMKNFGKTNLNSFILGKLEKLLAKGVIDKIPGTLFVEYKGYMGIGGNKFYIDLVDVCNMKFDWSKLEGENDEKPATTAPVNDGANMSANQSSEQDNGTMDGDRSVESGKSPDEMLPALQEFSLPEDIRKD